MTAWQMNGRINLDVIDPDRRLYDAPLAWSALPDAPAVPDRPQRPGVWRRLAAALRAATGRRRAAAEAGCGAAAYPC